MKTQAQRQSEISEQPADTEFNQAPAAASIVEVNGVGKHYDTEAGPVPVLRDIRLSVAIGEAGAIEKPDQGTVLINNQDIGTFGVRAQTDFRARHIGFVFQFFNLISTLTARENVIAGLEPLG